MSKIQIWKRITTCRLMLLMMIWLYLICQRYKFESESQPAHQSEHLQEAVFNMSKIQIWKRITTAEVDVHSCVWLYLICQRYKFESESQRTLMSCHLIRAVFNMSKIQIWKRITTVSSVVSQRQTLYLICQRYKFESESQPSSGSTAWWGCCI